MFKYLTTCTGSWVAQSVFALLGEVSCERSWSVGSSFTRLGPQTHWNWALLSHWSTWRDGFSNSVIRIQPQSRAWLVGGRTQLMYQMYKFVFWELFTYLRNILTHSLIYILTYTLTYLLTYLRNIITYLRNILTYLHTYVRAYLTYLLTYLHT